MGGIIGAVTGAIQAARAGKGPGQILLHALWGSVKGSHIALASAYGGPWAGAGAAACFATLESLVQTGGNLKQAFIAGNVAFGTSLASSGFSSLTGPIGDEAASAAITAVGQAMAKSAVQFTTSMLMSSGFAAVTGGLNSENWDDILIDNAISATISTVGNVTVTVTKGDSGSRGGGEATKGGGTDNGESPYLSADSDAAPKPAPGVADYDKEFRKQVEIVNNLKNSDQSGRKVAIIFENFKSGSEDQKEFNNKILPALVIMYQDKGYDDILLFRGATKAEYERIMSIGFKQRAISVWGHGEQPYSIHNPGGRLKLSNGDWMSMDVFNITPPGTRNDSIFFGVCWAGQQVHHISWANSANAWASPNKQRMNVFLWDFIDFMDHQR